MNSQVRDVMTRNVVSVRTNAEFKEILHVLRERGFSAFPVLDEDDTVIGVVSEDDLLVKEARPVSGRGFSWTRGDRAKAVATTAAELMTRPAITVRPNASLAEAARRMHAHRIKRLPVVTDDSQLVGIVSRIDLLGVYDRPDREIAKEILDEVVVGEFMLERPAFEVSVVSGVATVRGPVPERFVALSLLDSIRQVDGVIAVRDRLRYPAS